jgi:hypothetical protein
VPSVTPTSPDPEILERLIQSAVATITPDSFRLAADGRRSPGLRQARSEKSSSHSVVVEAKAKTMITECLDVGYRWALYADAHDVMPPHGDIHCGHAL